MKRGIITGSKHDVVIGILITTLCVYLIASVVIGGHPVSGGNMNPEEQYILRDREYIQGTIDPFAWHVLRILKWVAMTAAIGLIFGLTAKFSARAAGKERAGTCRCCTVLAACLWFVPVAITVLIALARAIYVFMNRELFQ